MIKRCPLNKICKKFTALCSAQPNSYQGCQTSLKFVNDKIVVMIFFFIQSGTLKHLIYIFTFIFNFLN